MGAIRSRTANDLSENGPHNWEYEEHREDEAAPTTDTTQRTAEEPRDSISKCFAVECVLEWVHYGRYEDRRPSINVDIGGYGFDTEAPKRTLVDRTFYSRCLWSVCPWPRFQLIFAR